VLDPLAGGPEIGAEEVGDVGLVLDDEDRLVGLEALRKRA